MYVSRHSALPARACTPGLGPPKTAELARLAAVASFSALQFAQVKRSATQSTQALEFKQSPPLCRSLRTTPTGPLCDLYFEGRRYIKGATVAKKTRAVESEKGGVRRRGVRRIRPDRRNTLRLKPDRRRNFGRRKDDRAEAAALQKQLCQARETAETFGPDNPRLATALTDLALFYYQQGKYADAEPLHQRALAIRKKAFEPTHPDVIASFQGLAALYYAQGRYAGAERLVKKLLAVLEQTHGPNHPLVADTLEDYAELLRARGKHDRAEVAAARAKVVRSKQR